MIRESASLRYSHSFLFRSRRGGVLYVYMKNHRSSAYYPIRFVLMLCVLAAGAFFAGASRADAVVAFPGAEGFGANALGGRGGTPIMVTNLNDSGAGSLRACIDAFGPRTCIFRTGGTIVLSSELTINNPFITIAGQTAPGGGITLKNASLRVQASEVIIRHIRVRSGDVPTANQQPWGIMVLWDNPPIQNIIIDHSSVSWGTDDHIGVLGHELGAGTTKNVTYQWNIISEALLIGFDPWGSVGTPSKAVLVDDTGGLSIHHNLIAHQFSRYPEQTAGDLDFVNNIIYNHKHERTMITPYWAPLRTNFVGNLYKAGPNTPAAAAEISLSGGSNLRGHSLFTSQSGVHVQGNISDIRPHNSLPENLILAQYDCNGECFSGTGIPLVARHNFPLVTTTDAFSAYNQVLANAGARKPALDSVDARIIADVTNGTGTWINYPSDVGGWPVLANGTPYADSDADGISDTWENSNGLNSNNPTDGPLFAANGYTNLENFINELAGSSGNQVPRPSIPSCNNLWNSSLTVPASFAASFNLFSTAKELLIEAFCGVLGTKTGAQVDVGNGSQLQFIYKTGHIWQNGAWSPFNYSGSAMSSDGNWFIGSASHQFDISSAELANKQSVLAYICDWIPSSDGTSAGKWKCGCSDSTCATPKWNLQQFKQ